MSSTAGPRAPEGFECENLEHHLGVVNCLARTSYHQVIRESIPILVRVVPHYAKSSRMHAGSPKYLSDNLYMFFGKREGISRLRESFEGPCCEFYIFP